MWRIELSDTHFHTQSDQDAIRGFKHSLPNSNAQTNRHADANADARPVMDPHSDMDASGFADASTHFDLATNLNARRRDRHADSNQHDRAKRYTDPATADPGAADEHVGGLRHEHA